MEISEEKIKEIAEELECGMVCYYNIKTGKVVSILDPDNYAMMNSEFWEKELRKIHSKINDYLIFENFDSRESFNMMADFANSINDKSLSDALLDALDRPKPFRRFKNVIDNSGPYREIWFEFKSMRYIESVKDQLNRHNNRIGM